MPEIDPSLFATSMEFELSFMLSGTFGKYSTALATIEADAQQNNPEARNALMKEMSELDDFKRIKEMLGDEFTAKIVEEGFLGDEIQRSLSKYSEDDIQKARQDITEAETTLASFVTGFAETTRNQAIHFFDDATDAEEATWSGTWRKLHGMLTDRDDTALVDVANFFDNLVRLQYADDYDPQATNRGMGVVSDISAVTFYEVFGNHLSRAIIRGTEDGWT
jgi:hypothetical protein